MFCTIFYSLVEFYQNTRESKSYARFSMVLSLCKDRKVDGACNQRQGGKTQGNYNFMVSSAGKHFKPVTTAGKLVTSGRN